MKICLKLLLFIIFFNRNYFSYLNITPKLSRIKCLVFKKTRILPNSTLRCYAPILPLRVQNNKKTRKRYVWGDMVGWVSGRIWLNKLQIYVWGKTVGSVWKRELSENEEKIRVGGYGGMSLEEDLTEKTENIRVGRYGGISLKTRIIRKWGKDTCGGIRWDESRGGFDWKNWKYTCGEIRWGQFWNENQQNNEKKYVWGDTVGSVAKLKKI